MRAIALAAILAAGPAGAATITQVWENRYPLEWNTQYHAFTGFDETLGALRSVKVGLEASGNLTLSAVAGTGFGSMTLTPYSGGTIIVSAGYNSLMQGTKSTSATVVLGPGESWHSSSKWTISRAALLTDGLSYFLGPDALLNVYLSGYSDTGRYTWPEYATGGGFSNVSYELSLTYNYDLPGVPLPASGTLLLAGLAAIFTHRRARRRL